MKKKEERIVRFSLLLRFVNTVRNCWQFSTTNVDTEKGKYQPLQAL